MGGDASYDVFVSYSRSDEVGAAELNGWLRAQGLSTFYDRTELRPGLRWIPGLEDAIGRSRAVAKKAGADEHAGVIIEVKGGAAYFHADRKHALHAARSQ